MNRFTRILKGIEATQGQVPLEQFYGIVVILNAPNIDLGAVGPVPITIGSLMKPYGLVVLDASPTVWSPSAAAHEMGHGYGLPHSWSAMPYPVEDGDAWDIMSRGYSFNGPYFSPSGPGLIAPYLQKLGWLNDNRVEMIDILDHSEFTLRALGHPEAEGPLAARLDLIDQDGSPLTYMVEYRHRDRWDSGIPGDVLLIHQVPSDGLSYLKSSLKIGEQYMDVQNGFGIYVQDIDSTTFTAKFLIGINPTVTLDGSVVTIAKFPVGSGTYHFPGRRFCPAKDYTYTESQQVQEGNFQATAAFFDPQTLGYKWYLNDQLLDPSAPSVVLFVTKQSALPPPSGEIAYNIPVTVSYSIDPKPAALSFSLSNDPHDGNYSVVLRVTATDNNGNNASDSITIDFAGDILDFEKSYYVDMGRCLSEWRAYLWTKRPRPKKPKKGGDPGRYPLAKKKIARLIHDIVLRRTSPFRRVAKNVRPHSRREPAPQFATHQSWHEKEEIATLEA